MEVLHLIVILICNKTAELKTPIESMELRNWIYKSVVVQISVEGKLSTEAWILCLGMYLEGVSLKVLRCSVICSIGLCWICKNVLAHSGLSLWLWYSCFMSKILIALATFSCFLKLLFSLWGLLSSVHS